MADRKGALTHLPTWDSTHGELWSKPGAIEEESRRIQSWPLIHHIPRRKHLLMRAKLLSLLSMDLDLSNPFCPQRAPYPIAPALGSQEKFPSISDLVEPPSGS